MDSKDTTMMTNPMAGRESEAKSETRSETTVHKKEKGARSGLGGEAKTVEMVQLTVRAQSRKAKRRSYEKRQATLKKLNQRKPTRIGENPMLSVGRVSFDYEAADDDEINLAEGDMIDNIHDIGGGWSVGRNARTGETGAFPSSFLETSSSAS